MAKLLTQVQRSRYERDGLLFPISVLTPEEAETYRRTCDDLELRLGGKPRTIEVRQMHLHWPWAHQLATHPRILDAVENILGPDLLVWATELFAKHPRDKAVSIGWHRDRPYMGFDPAHTTTAWVALSDSTSANGCMCAVPGPARRQAPSAKEPAKDEGPIVEVVLRAGEMSLHDAEILHGSKPNRSEEKRVGFVIRFVTPRAGPFATRPPAILARGTDRYQHFSLVGPPHDTDPDRAVFAMKASAALHLDAMLGNLRRAEG